MITTPESCLTTLQRLAADGKLHDKNAEESWALLEDLALYDNESCNDPRDFAKPIKAIYLPQDVPGTSDLRLIELENQVQRLMEAHLAPKSSNQVNKIGSSCEICSGPHDTQYCMENPEQAFADYAYGDGYATYLRFVWSCPNFSAPAGRTFSCDLGDILEVDRVAIPVFAIVQVWTTWYQSQGYRELANASQDEEPKRLAGMAVDSLGGGTCVRCMCMALLHKSWDGGSNGAKDYAEGCVKFLGLTMTMRLVKEMDSIKKVKKRGNVGDTSKDKNGRDDNKRTRTGNDFATTVKHYWKKELWVT
ncbi:hypothetical protein Tco_0168215 [Tanacetum coccineum]